MKNETFEIGESVHHPIFGEGVVTACAGPRRLGFSPTNRFFSVNEPRPLDWPSTPEMDGESHRVKVKVKFKFKEYGNKWLVPVYANLESGSGPEWNTRHASNEPESPLLPESRSLPEPRVETQAKALPKQIQAAS